MKMILVNRHKRLDMAQAMKLLSDEPPLPMRITPQKRPVFPIFLQPVEQTPLALGVVPRTMRRQRPWLQTEDKTTVAHT